MTITLNSLLANEIIEGLTDTLSQANKAYNDFKAEKSDYLTYWIELIVLESERAALTVSHDSNTDTMTKEAIELAFDAIPTDYKFWGNIRDTAKNAAKLAITHSSDRALRKAIVSKTIEIQKKKVEVASSLKLVDSTYIHYVAHQLAFNGSNDTPSDDTPPTKKGRIPSDGIGVDTDLELPCDNPNCDTVWKASEHGLENILALSESAPGHQFMTCSHKHSSSGETGVTYWTCDSPSCPRSDEHWVFCKGGCGEKGYKVLGTLKNGGINSGLPFITELEIITIFDHIKRCPSYVKKKHWLYGYVTEPCRMFYHQCNSSNTCPNAENHVDDDDETATAPDRPGSFSLSPFRRMIGLKWTDSASDGGSPITDYQYQIRKATGSRTWGSWSSWNSAGTDNHEFITGLSPNTKYAVRMRAVNKVGPSKVTGLQITRTWK